jgi:hypothetical protein
MKRIKNLDMAKIEKLFNDNFTFEKNDLKKGFTYFTLTPKREENQINKKDQKK